MAMWSLTDCGTLFQSTSMVPCVPLRPIATVPGTVTLKVYSIVQGSVVCWRHRQQQQYAIETRGAQHLYSCGLRQKMGTPEGVSRRWGAGLDVAPTFADYKI